MAMGLLGVLYVSSYMIQHGQINQHFLNAYNIEFNRAKRKKYFKLTKDEVLQYIGEHTWLSSDDLVANHPQIISLKRVLEAVRYKSFSAPPLKCVATLFPYPQDLGARKKVLHFASGRYWNNVR